MFKRKRISNMQSVCDVQIKYKHARLMKLHEKPLKAHATLKRVMFTLSELTITITRSPPQFQDDVPIEIVSNYLSKNPNGRKSLRQLDSLIAVINNSKQACIHS